VKKLHNREESERLDEKNLKTTTKTKREEVNEAEGYFSLYDPLIQGRR